MSTRRSCGVLRRRPQGCSLCAFLKTGLVSGNATARADPNYRLLESVQNPGQSSPQARTYVNRTFSVAWAEITIDCRDPEALAEFWSRLLSIDGRAAAPRMGKDAFGSSGRTGSELPTGLGAKGGQVSNSPRPLD